MITVKQILQTKGYDIWSVTPDTLVLEALKLMAEKDIGAVLVLEAGQVVGIMSERDYARKVILLGKSSGSTPVKEIMTEKVIYLRPEQTVEECMALMTSRNIRHVPVLAEGRLVGIISMRDVVEAIISQQEFIIEQLENYITGR
jgi:CBS domain-containing protein